MRLADERRCQHGSGNNAFDLHNMAANSMLSLLRLDRSRYRDKYAPSHRAKVRNNEETGYAGRLLACHALGDELVGVAIASMV